MAEAFLALEDGAIFRGEAFGARATSVGEVVFNTSMTGYQEILTDPSYAGQIVTPTYPSSATTASTRQTANRGASRSGASSSGSTATGPATSGMR